MVVHVTVTILITLLIWQVSYLPSISNPLGKLILNLATYSLICIWIIALADEVTFQVQLCLKIATPEIHSSQQNLLVN